MKKPLSKEGAWTIIMGSLVFAPSVLYIIYTLTK
jgi:hypothetical protein